MRSSGSLLMSLNLAIPLACIQIKFNQLDGVDPQRELTQPCPPTGRISGNQERYRSWLAD